MNFNNVKMDKAKFLDCLNKPNKLELCLSTRDAEEISGIVSFLEVKKYGRIKSGLSEYGLLYLIAASTEQKKAFFEDVFAQNPPRQLAKIANIEYVERKYHLPEEHNLPYNENTAHLAEFPGLIEGCVAGLDWSSSQQADENLVRVAIVDTGVDYTHTKLKTKFDLTNVGKNFVQDFTGCVKPLPEDKPLDQFGHGTHVAGIVVQRAPNIRIYSLKILDNKGDGDPDYLLEAIKWCKDTGVDIINLSVGGYKYHSGCEEAIRNLPNKVVLVAAAGNEKLGVNYPANYPRVISVGSVNESRIHSPFSNIWHSVDISAPGENMASTFPNETYAVLSGTSMAVPQVTANIAAGLTLLKKKGKIWSSEDIERIFKETAEQPPDDVLENLMQECGLRTPEETKNWAYGAGIADKSAFLNKLKQEYPAED